ncbi:MAG: DUF924 family protein [Pseudomonadota bacterium]
MPGSDLTPETFRQHPDVIRAVEIPRSSRSVLNYMCACDTADPEIRASLNLDEAVQPLMTVWFQSGRALDAFCQPFAPVVRELKADPPTLMGEDWNSLDGKVAKVLLADQLSRSCFRGDAEAFVYDPIARDLMHALMGPQMIAETLTLPAAILYLLPWALAHSEDVADLDLACDFVDLAIGAYPNFKLFSERCKPAIDQHREVLQKFGRYPQRNAEFGRENTTAETSWLDDKDNLPVWAGGRASFSQKLDG